MKELSKCLKNLLSETVLQQPEFNKNFILKTDAPNVGLGAVLCQEFRRHKLPVAFAPRDLECGKKLLDQLKRNDCSLRAMEHFKYFLLGREFNNITNHKALKALKNRSTIQSARIVR